MVVGGGVAGLSAAVFTARHGLDTLVLDAGESILRRNAHLENFPGFPAGVNARLLLDMLGDQADRASCERQEATVRRVDGLYAAGRLAEKPHQAIVCAGHGAEVAVTLLEDDDRPFYHDWVTPEGYFTDRGRDLPPGCEEIGEEKRRNRETESLGTMREYLAEPHPDEQVTHPSLREE